MNPIRVLYSFPHKIGAGRISYTAWHQVNGMADHGADILAHPASVHKPLSRAVRVRSTLALGPVRVPFKMLGSMRAFALHDHIVARRLRKLTGEIDVIHTWPLGALETLKAARELGIPTVLERPNAHTRFAYDVVREECARIGVQLPPRHEHAYNETVLAKEEQEYRLADGLLCPSNFVVKTFLHHGFAGQKLLRHQYGFDPDVFFPKRESTEKTRGLQMLFVGVCAVRKGLHFALEAWLSSPAHRDGTFLIAGDFIPEYAAKLAPLLAHPSIRVLGDRRDVPELMRNSDVLTLPSIEEGFGLVCAEAIGSGCVPLVSDACTDLCRHMENALVHRAGDVLALRDHITMLYENRTLLEQLRAQGLRGASGLTWSAAGRSLLEAYAVATKVDSGIVRRNHT